MKKLTKEQCKLIEDNMNLVYFYIHTHGLNVTECEGELMECFCRVAPKWDKNKGSLSSYLFKCFDHRRHVLWKYDTRKCRTLPKGVEHIYLNGESKVEDIPMDELCGINDDSFKSLELKELVKQLRGVMIKNYNSNYIKVLDCMLQEKGVNDIADTVGITRQYVHHIKKAIRKEFCELNGI